MALSGEPREKKAGEPAAGRDSVSRVERDRRRRAEESLRHSEEIFRLLVEGVRDYAIFGLDPAGRVATWNLGAERIKGYTAEEVIGQHLSLFYPQEEVERGRPDHVLEVAAAEGRFEDEGWRVRKDGSLFWAHVILTAIYDGDRLCGFSKVTRDLSEKRRVEQELRQARDLLEKRVQERTAELMRANARLRREIEERGKAEQELRESEERLRRLVVALPLAVYTTDPEGRITLFNDHAAEMWGRRPEIGQDLWCGSYRIFQPDGTPLPHDQCPMAVTLREGQVVRGQEILIERPDGSRFCILPYPELLRNAAGKVVGAVNMLVDITDRKRSEEELLERSEQIGKLVQELEAADRRKNEFLATLAHELRNPLAPIRHALELLGLAPEDSDARPQALAVIERQLGQMVRLVDDLLDVSRITNNKLQLRMERIELAAAVHSALETTRPFIEEAGHELTVVLPPDPVYVDADLTRLAQVFINLLNNATKYTERGGRIWLTVAAQGGEAVVSVRDNGIGIKAEHLPHLFAMFSQASPALERSGGGLGVGLALARGVVGRHGGSIEARSEGLGKGSELIIRLPVAAAPGERRPQPSRDGEEALRGSQCRVLVADDNRDSADSLSLLLEFDGNEVWTAHDGLAAVQAAETHNPDVALLDIGMPKLNGYEVAHRIRQQPGGERMLLVAITGWGQDDDKQRAREAGFDHHLTKPVSLEGLKKLLAAARDRQLSGRAGS